MVTLDPAAGTGTYPLAVVDHALGRAERDEGPGAVAGHAQALAKQVFAFEWMVGPYAVAELRLSQELRRRGAELPPEGPPIYLHNTLGSPFAVPPIGSLFESVLTGENRRALDLKRNTDVLVCLGNPPYDRHDAATEHSDEGAIGGWVRFGEKGERPILDDLLETAKTAGHGGDLKNAYNLYVYFWRWAIWKVFQFDEARGESGAATPGLVSFITASSYLTGTAFVGLRELMRRECDAVYILDLGGEGRGTRKEPNVFAIQTPVCVAVCVRLGKPDRTTPAVVKYHRVRAETRAAKLAALDAIGSLADVPWKPCPDGWHDSFTPAGVGAYFKAPLVTDLFPWTSNGVQAKRTWPIGTTKEVLLERWATLLRHEDRAKAFRESKGDREINKTYTGVPDVPQQDVPIAELEIGAEAPQIRRFAYRSFDRQHVFADGRILSRNRPPLWISRGGQQCFLTTLINHPLGRGPALTAAADVPDMHHFRGSYGAKEILPLYRDAAGREPNVAPKLLEYLCESVGIEATAEDLFAYAYALLAHPGYTDTYWDELETCEVRVPLTADAGLFAEAADFGGRLLWLHTYGERFAHAADPAGFPRGSARCTVAVPATPLPEDFSHDAATSTLHVGGGRFAPVSRAAWEFEVSGLKVLRSWLDDRSADPGGKRSSPLDDIRPAAWTAAFTTELLKLLAILETTLAGYPAQADLLERIAAGPLVNAANLPPVPKVARKPPAPPAAGRGEFTWEEE